MLDKVKKELRVGKTFLQFVIPKTLGQGLAMIMPLAIARFFSEELFGSYSLARMIIFFFTTLLISSAQTPFIVFANQERAATGKINKTFSVQCLVLFTSLVFFIILSTVFREQILSFTKISEAELVFLRLAFIGILAKSFMCNLMLALGHRLRNALTEMVFGVLSCLLVFLFYFIGGLTLKNVFLVYFISGLVTLLLLIKAVGWERLLPFTFSSEHAVKMLNFTKWLALGSTAVYFINWGDNLVLRYYNSMDEIGTYNLAYQVFKGIATLMTAIYAYFLPFISEHISNEDKVRDYLLRKRPKILTVGLLSMALLFVFLPYFFRVIYTDSYEEAGLVLRILLIGTALLLYCILYEPVLQALKRYKFSQQLNLFQVVLNLVLDILLVPQVGIIGAAVATVIAYAVKAAVFEAYFRIMLRRLIKNG